MKHRNPNSPGHDRSYGQASVQDVPKKDISEGLNFKIEPEYGTEGGDPSELQPAMENQWLNNISSFEQDYKYAKRIKVFDFIGRPAFKKLDDMKPEQIGGELQRVQSIMEEKGIALDFNSDYDNAIIYRFLTEELFEHEIDDVSAKGMVTHFMYEEFHPNHDHDLRRYADEFIEIVFRKKWGRFDSHCFARNVAFKGSDYDGEGIASIIQAYQEAHDLFLVEQFQIQDVKFDLIKEQAEVHARIRYRTQGNGNGFFEGTCRINFHFQWGYWYISGFRLPGFGD